MVELPRDCHRLLADVAAVGRWAEEPERPVVSSQTRKQGPCIQAISSLLKRLVQPGRAGPAHSSVSAAP
jgi:hypothetical protein